MTNILNYFGLYKGECPYRKGNNTKISPNGACISASYNFVNLITVGFPLAFCVGSVNSLAALAFRANPIIPGIIGTITFITSHAVDMVAHLINDDHHQKTLYNVMRFSLNLLYSLSLFQVAADIYPTPFSPAAKTCFVILPNAIDWALQYYFHTPNEA